MKRVPARAAKRYIRRDIDVVRRNLGATGGTGDLHEIDGIMP